jgi:hypothetical protein
MAMKNIGARGVAECAFEVLDSSGVGDVYAEQIYSSQKAAFAWGRVGNYNFETPIRTSPNRQA